MENGVQDWIWSAGGKMKIGQDNEDPCLNGSGAIDCGMVNINVDHLKSAAPRTGFSIALPTSPSKDPIWNELAERARVMNNIPADGTGNITHMIYPPSSITSPVRLQPPAIHGVSTASLSKECVYKYRTKVASNDVASIDFSGENGRVKELSWKRFDILPCAPVDYAFHLNPSDQPEKVFSLVSRISCVGKWPTRYDSALTDQLFSTYHSTNRVG